MSPRQQCANLLLAFVFGCLSVAAAMAAEPLARARLRQQGTIYVGQQVLVDVDVLVPNYFMQPPQFPEIELPDAIVTLQDEQAFNFSETIDGTSYSGIRRSYAITPQREGEFTLPAAEIAFGYAAVPGKTTQGKTALPQLRLIVDPFPATAAGKTGMVASKVTVMQELHPDPQGLKAGDTLLRTITIQAEGLQAMMIPPPDFSAVEGVRIYRSAPVLSDERARTGSSTAGIRKDVVQYLFDSPGQYELPAVELAWFNPATGATETASASLVMVTVAKAPPFATGLAPPPSQPETVSFAWRLLIAIAAGVAVSALTICLFAYALKRLEKVWEANRSSELESEVSCFRRVEDACQDAVPSDIAKALDIWSRKAGTAPLSPWFARFADHETIKMFDRLQRILYREEKAEYTFDERFASGVRKARAAWLRASGTRRLPLWRGKSLPQLNPSWNGKQRMG
jgi:hypothetical protein